LISGIILKAALLSTKQKSSLLRQEFVARTDLNTYQYSPDKMEYSEAKMMLATDWKWGS